MPEAPLINPFIAGPPVQGMYFINRERDLHIILERLIHPTTPQSTVVVGQPHVGKSSLLLRLTDATFQHQRLLNASWVVVYCDLHMIPLDYTPAAFWGEVLAPLRHQPQQAALSRHLRQAEAARYDKGSLERVFKYLAQRQGRRLLLLLDEFERLLRHANFHDPGFFGTLRSLANNSGGLALVAASRLSVAAMNAEGRGLLDINSPFFNNVLQVELLPFDAAAIEQLLQQGEERFSATDRAFIRRWAGPSPFLLQATAAQLYPLPLTLPASERYQRAARGVIHGFAHHFDDLWNALDDGSRTTAVMLCLAEWGNAALGRTFDNQDITHPEQFRVELERLTNLGLAERVTEGFGRRRQERWRNSSAAFAWWVHNHVIAAARPSIAAETWLQQRQYRRFLTEERWQHLVGAAREARRLAAESLAIFVKNVVEQLTGGGTW